MQMALDALEALFGKKRQDLPTLNALRDQLAQPEPEPVLWRYRTVTFWNSKPQWRYLDSLEGVEGLLGLEPLYTAPPKRKWVGLTDEERYQAEACCWYMDEFDQTIYAEAIEAKLKEKNT
jgi:hypothetical protein